VKVLNPLQQPGLPKSAAIAISRPGSVPNFDIQSGDVMDGVLRTFADQGTSPSIFTVTHRLPVDLHRTIGQRQDIRLGRISPVVGDQGHFMILSILVVLAGAGKSPGQ
jgi:hypothetical protein